MFARLTLSVYLIVSLTAALVSSQLASQETEPMLWAILCDDNLREYGLSDLLTSKLSEDANFALVERDLLEQVNEEAEIALAFVDPTSRIKLGARLSADRLILVSTEQKAGQEVLVLCICDCNFGVRLAERGIEIADTDIEKSAEICAATASEIRDRFAGGIELIVGIAPFQSQNLTHEFDTYQQRFSYLLRSSLLEQEGVAAIEMDEAIAIQKEMAASSREVDPSVFAFIDGQFRFGETEEKEQVQFDLRVQRSAEDQSVSQGPFSLEEATRFLSTELPRTILASKYSENNNASNFSRWKWLSSQADIFSLRGDWAESTAIREAAILLNPSHAELRLRNLSDYMSLCRSDVQQPGLSRIGRKNIDKIDAMAAERINSYLTFLEHLEYLIRNRLITAKQAMEATQDSMFFTEFGLRDVMRGRIAAIAPVEEKFFLKVTPLILDLPRVIKGLPTEWDEDSEFGLRFRLHDKQLKAFRRPFQNAGANYETIFHLVTEVIPEGSVLSNEMQNLFGRPQFRGGQGWSNFVQKLIDSDNSTAKLLGKYAKLKSKMTPRIPRGEAKRKADPIETKSWAEEVEKLLMEYDKLPYSTDLIKIGAREFEPIRKDLFVEGKRLTALLEANADMGTARTKVPGVTKIDYSHAAGVVTSKPLQINLKRIGASDKELINLSTQSDLHIGKRTTWPARFDATVARPSSSGMLQMTKCGDVDVWWHHGVILIMREKGLLEEAVVDADAFFSDVCWDGENIWVASQLKGLFILDRETLEFSHTCDATNGLPHADKRMQIIPTEEGKLLVVGSFGKNCRGWCATVSLIGNEITAEVFHEAKKVGFASDPDNPDWSDTQSVFIPAWVAEYRDENEAQKFLVGRAHPRLSGGRNMYFSESHRPLLIDLKSKSVTVFGRETTISSTSRALDNRETFFSSGGDLYRCRRFRVVRIKSPELGGDKYEAFERLGDLREGIEFERRYHPKIPELHRFLKTDDAVVIPGIQWLALDTEQMSLSLYSSPDADSILEVRQFYGFSAHYGFIGWNGSFHKESFNFTEYQLEKR